jgi:hypothetical protein
MCILQINRLQFGQTINIQHITVKPTVFESYCTPFLQNILAVQNLRADSATYKLTTEILNALNNKLLVRVIFVI